MAKVFDLDLRQGTLIDSINRVEGTLTNTDGFKVADKGKVLRFPNSFDGRLCFGSDNYINSTEPFSIVVGFKHKEFDGTSYPILCSLKTEESQNWYMGLSNNATYGDLYIGNNIGGDTDWVRIKCNINNINDWNLVIVTFDGSNETDINAFNAYINNSEETFSAIGSSLYSNTGDNCLGGSDTISDSNDTDFCGDIGYKFMIFDHVLSDRERADIYEEFLNSRNIQPPIKDFYYLKPTDLSNEPNLVASYNFKDGSVVDISGNGNNGTKVGAPLTTLNGMRFDGTNDYINCGSDPTIDNIWAGGGKMVWRGTTNVTARRMAGKRNVVGNKGWEVLASTRAGSQMAIRLLAEFSGSNATWVTTNAVVTEGEPFTLEIEYDSDSTANDPVIKINGESVAVTESVAPSGTYGDDSGEDLEIGAYDGGTGTLTGEIEYAAFYNTSSPTIQTIDGNYFNKQVYLHETFKYGADGVVKDIPNWQAASGTWKINELSTADSVLKDLNIGTSYLECTTAGQIATQSKQAYGHWRLVLYKGGASTVPIVHFITDALPADNGYRLNIDASERVELVEVQGGSANTVLFRTDVSYVEVDKYYIFDIYRSLAGEFTVYVSGGNFGNTPTLVDPSGGTGTNPVTDTTHTTSEYFGYDLDELDRTANILLRKGITQ